MANYTTTDVIQLPRLQASGAMALGEQLAAAAKANKKLFSKSITKAYNGLDTSHTTLSIAIRDQVGPDTEISIDKVALDRNIDGCWSGFGDFLTAFTKLPNAVEAVEAAALQTAIFPDGLKFILLPYALEWAESETRLQRISKNGLDTRIKALGGGIFLSAIQKAHDAYGKALGMTTPTKPGASAPSIREPLDAFSAALRIYIIKVLAHIEADEPETQKLADALLAPLRAWDIGPTAKPTKDAEPEATNEGSAGAPTG